MAGSSTILNILTLTPIDNNLSHLFATDREKWQYGHAMARRPKALGHRVACPCKKTKLTHHWKNIAGHYSFHAPFAH